LIAMIAAQKNSVDLTAIVQAAGVEFNRAGMALCPFHSEKTPSFKVYEKNGVQRCHCFGCGFDEDVIGFVMKYYNLSFQDALRYLGIETGLVTPKVRRKIEKRKRQAGLLKAFRLWEIRKADELATLIRCTYKVVATWKSIDDLERSGGILQPLTFYEYCFDILIHGDDKQKYQFYKEAHNNGKFQSWK